MRLRPPPRLSEASSELRQAGPREAVHSRGSGPGLLVAAALFALLAVGAVGFLTRNPEPSESLPAVPAELVELENLPAEAPPDPELGLVASEKLPPAAIEDPTPVAEAPVGILESTRPSPASRDPFVEAMSAGFLALGQEDSGAARLAFERAIELRPEAPEARDALALADEAIGHARLMELQRKAQELEDEEEWRGAAGSYDQALVLLPSLELARVGRERCIERAELSDLLDYHLRHPERLAATEVFSEVSALVARTASLEPQGPKLADQRRRLEELLRVAATPVRAVLESDDLTEVIVYRVGELGKFRRQVLELRPGIYTVVGHRRGYRDVRLRWEIVSGEAPPLLVVRCEEEI